MYDSCQRRYELQNDQILPWAYRRHILYVHIGLICGYKEAIQETYMAVYAHICTSILPNVAYISIYAAYILSYMCIYTAYRFHICAYILHIVFIYAHISSYRFFPCGILDYYELKTYRHIFNLLNNNRVSEFLDMVRFTYFSELSTTFQLIVLGWVHNMLFYPCF